MKTWKARTPLAIAAALVLLCAVGGLGAGPQASLSADESTFEVTGTTTPLLQYQARLTNPADDTNVSDGTYTIVFRLYTVPEGGSALWTETKDVAVAGGLFSTILGDMVPLSQTLFNGQGLWLGVKVGTDPEATPRQALLPVAYALSLVPGAVIQANSSSAALQLANLGTGEALNITGPAVVDGNLTVNGALTGASHAHSGADITSGTVAEPRIDAAIARESEILPTVLAGDGAGSTLDADLLDGQQAAAFAAASHTHDHGKLTGLEYDDHTQYFHLSQNEKVNGVPTFNGGSASVPPFYVSSGYAVPNLNADLVDGYQASSLFALNENETVTGIPAFNGGTTSAPPFYVDSNYPVTNLNADLLDGYSAANFSLTSHDHDTRYYTQATSESRYVNATGDTMSGVLTVPRVAYSSPRTHYYSLSSEAFQPYIDVPYSNSGGTGGAYIIATGSPWLVAPVHLPHGAVVTEFRVYFDDTSAGDMTVSLQAQGMSSSYVILAQVISSGTGGYYSLVDTSIASATIDNLSYGYYVKAYSGAWESTLRIKGAVITYTISEAP